MVYTSIPAYIDPANWQQQQPNHHQPGNTDASSHHLLPPPPPPPPSTQPHGAGGNTGSIRPGSMADRARMASIPMHEAQQKCPRCESTNTKFCYFNNYSLSQPRHFCKTCRRYWTRGGALRNVPVGGGCRRNKRSKGSSSSSSRSSPASSDRQMLSATSTNSITSDDNMVGLGPPVPPPLRFMAPLHQLGGDHNFAGGGGDMSLNYGMNYGAISSPMGGVGDLNFHLGSAFNGDGSGGGGSILSAAGLEQWRVPPQTHQFPFLSGLEASSHGLYPFEGGSTNPAPPGYGEFRPKVSTSGVISQMASVKMEESRQELNLSRQLLGINNSASDQQYWSTSGGGGGGTTPAAWTNISGFSSSSTPRN